ncbi:MAG TPA: class I SAM-dependent methyltransferase [Gaiellaceae bacterium]|nr:class I SAM-dependent methyltransferase [Gaiellaceae bacterium]
MKAYYDARAPEYDEWYLGLGRFDGLERPQWDNELHALERTLAALPALRTLDVACGTGFLTQHLSGEVTGLDQSASMLEVARARMPAAKLVQADAPPLPFADASFDRVFTAHFYGHLEEPARSDFLAEARRVAPELVVVDSAVRPDRDRVGTQERILNDGTRWNVFKRYFEPDELAAELGGGETLFAGRWFVAVRA